MANEFCEDGITVTPDHDLQVFTVAIRSMSPVAASRLKDIIETQHEVISCNEISRTYVVADNLPPYPGHDVLKASMMETDEALESQRVLAIS